MSENYEMVLRYGFDWRAKVADMILAEWRALPWYKRAYWKLRGKAPADRETLIGSLS
jgi:hypothetical protein